MRFIAVALGALALMLAVSTSALADSTWTDPTGDQPSGLDITTIKVSNDPVAGTITFAVGIANTPTLTDQQEIDVFIDADQNPSTGDPAFAGADYNFALFNDGYEFGKWDATQGKWVEGGPGDFQVFYGPQHGGLSWTLTPSDLGSVTAFNFFAATFTANPNDASTPFVDLAPDSAPVYSYTLTAAPVTPTVPATKPSVQSTTPTVSGSGKAGTTYAIKSLAVNLSNGTTVNAKNLKCTATLGGASFKGTGAGGCTFKLPKTAKGKKLVVHATGNYGNVKVGATESVKVH